MSATQELLLFPESISSVGASRAKTSRMQAKALDWKASARDSGTSSLESFARWDRASLSWKTSQRLLLGGWTPYSERWPTTGMMRDGTAYALPTLALRTDESGCSLWPVDVWPTPGSMDGSSAQLRNTPEIWAEQSAKHAAKGAHKQYPLGVAAQLNASEPMAARLLWPTPAAGNPNDGESLETWTARREELKAKGTNGNGCGTPLGVAIRMWPTPQSFDANECHRSPEALARAKEVGGCSNLREAVTGSLNPAWVEMLQGFPAGWTVIDGPLPAAPRSTNTSRRAPSKARPKATTKTSKAKKSEPSSKVPETGGRD